MKYKKIAVIGAGLVGLTSAYKLAKAGVEVEVFEKAETAGGLAGSFMLGKTRLEKTYHHIFKTDTEIIELINQLGLGDKLEWHKSSVGIYWQGKMYPFSTPKDVLTFDAIPLPDRIRSGMVALWLSKDNNWKKYEKVSAAWWMRKWGGENAYRVIWEPMLKGKFHEHYEQVSMAWLWARVNSRGPSRDKSGQEVLGYLRGGFEQMVEELQKRATKAGVKFHFKAEVSPQDLEKKFDLVIYSGKLSGVEYLGFVNLIIQTPQRLTKYYWHNINDPKSPFLALVAHTNLVETKDYGNKNVYYLGNYLPQDHRLMTLSEAEVKKEFSRYLKKMFPEFEPKLVEKEFMFRFPLAQHVVKVGFEPPKMWVGPKTVQLSFGQTYPQDRGMSIAIRQANKLMEELEKK
ncbi:MAG: FAD-dependent oxidoreductase [Candidatus Shapirobacteria bacterium]